jgi:hypothetical protein
MFSEVRFSMIMSAATLIKTRVDFYLLRPTETNFLLSLFAGKIFCDAAAANTLSLNPIIGRLDWKLVPNWQCTIETTAA